MSDLFLPLRQCIGTINDVRIHSDDGNDLEKQREPISVAAKVWEIVRNSLTCKINSTHPLVIIIY